MTNNTTQEWLDFIEWCKANDRNVKDGKTLQDYLAQLKGDKK